MNIFFLFCFTADSTAINLKFVGVIVTDHGGLLLKLCCYRKCCSAVAATNKATALHTE